MLKGKDFFVRACAAILLLRLFTPTFFSNEYAIVRQELSNLMVSGLIFVLWLVFAVWKFWCREHLERTIFDLSIAILLGAVFLSLTQSVYLCSSLKFAVQLVSCVLFFHILVNVLETRKDLSNFLFLIFIPAAAIVFLSIWEYSFGDNFQGHSYKRVGSLFGYPNVLAGYLMLVIPLAWAALITASEIWEKRVAAVWMAVLLLAFSLTLSFLCSINFIIATVILTPLIAKQWLGKSVDKKIYWAIGASVVIFLIFIVVIRGDLVLYPRLEYLRVACLLLKDNPWFGTGADTFEIVSPQYVTYFQGFSAYVHNSYLQLWVETGILGLIAMLLFIGAFVKSAAAALKATKEHNRRVFLIAFIWALSAFFIDNMSSFTMLRPDAALFWWATLAGYVSLIRKEQSQQTYPWKSSRVFLILFSIVAAVAIAVNVRSSIALFNYQQGLTDFLQRDIDMALVSVQQAEEIDPQDEHFFAAAGLVYINKYLMTKDPHYLEDAEKSFKKAARLSPHFCDNYVFLSKIAWEQKDKVKLEQYMKQVQKLCPLKYASLKKELMGKKQP